MTNVILSNTVEFRDLVSRVENLEDLGIVFDVKGGWDVTSALTLPDSAYKGEFWRVEGSGTFDGVTFEDGDGIVSIATNASRTTISGNWYVWKNAGVSLSDVTDYIDENRYIVNLEYVSGTNDISFTSTENHTPKNLTTTYRFVATVANTGNMRVRIDGGEYTSLLLNNGLQIGAGGLVTGGVYEFVKTSASEYRLTNGSSFDANVNAVIAEARAWADGTEPDGPGTKSSKEYAIDAGNSANSASLSSASAGVASGRLEVSTRDEISTKFVYSSPTAGQQIVASGDIIADRSSGQNYRVAAEGTAAGGKIEVLGVVSVEVLPSNGGLDPRSFGVITGEGQTALVGQNNVSIINSVLDLAAEIGSKVVFPTGQVIEIANATESVEIPSGIVVEGNRCVIKAQDDTGPIIVSKAWARNTAPKGNGLVHGLIALGTLTNDDIFTTGVGSPTTQDGIIVYDYFSQWIKCEAWRCRGRGIVAEESNSIGGTTSGTLVENRFEQCIARNNAGRGFDFAPDQLGKLTDGWLLDAIVSQPKGCTWEAIRLGQGSGWNVRDFHTYGGDPARAVVISRGYQTNIGDGYIETYTRTALHLPESQQNVSVGNIGVRSNKVTHASAAVLEAERSSGVTTANITVHSIQDENNIGGAHLLIRNVFGSSLPISLGSYQIKGTNANLVTLPTASDVWLSMPPQGVVIGRMTDVIEESYLSYNNAQLMTGTQQTWSGGGEKSITFSIPYVSYYHTNRKIVCDLTIFSFQNHNNTTRTTYTAKLCIGGRDSGGAWKAILIPTSTAFGFSVAPAVGSLSVTGTLSGTNPNGVDVTITFTPTDSDGFGTASLLLGPTIGD